MIELDAAAYSAAGVSAQAQGALLKGFAQLKALDADAESKWVPVFGTWAFFVGCASVLAVMTFFAVRSVTKARLAILESHHTQSFDEGMAERNTRAPRRMDRNARTAMLQAKFDHYNLCFQFGSAAVLLIIAFGLLLFDCIKGWEVHTNPVMLALALLIIMLSYFAQATPTVALIMVNRHTHSLSLSLLTFCPTSVPCHSRKEHGRYRYAAHTLYVSYWRAFTAIIRRQRLCWREEASRGQ